MFKEDYRSINMSAEEYRREYLSNTSGGIDPYYRRDPLYELEQQIAKALDHDRKVNEGQFFKIQAEIQSKIEEVVAKFAADQAVLNQEIAKQNEIIEDLRDQIKSLQQDMEVHNIGSDAW